MTSGTGPQHDGTSGVAPMLGCVILAHADPVHLHRLIRALDPFPVFLHCDVDTPEHVFEEMVAGLPERCTVMPRISTGWAKWENVAAELAGYRAALALPDVTHVALMTGADYPLASTAEIARVLAEHEGRSIANYLRMPNPRWGRSGGLARLQFRHVAFRKHMIRFPLPRRIPRDVVPAGGSQVKVLARRHAQALVDVAAARPDLVAFWRRSWVADETFVGSVLSSPALVPGWSEEHVPADLWCIGWDGSRRKSPPWFDMAHLDWLTAARAGEIGIAPMLFARKFSSSASAEVLDVIDGSFRCSSVPQA